VQRIERLAALLVAIVTLASLVLRDHRITLGVALGGAVAVLNFWGLRRILQGIVRAQGRKQALLGLLLSLKFGALAAALYLVIRVAPVHPIALLVGISTVVIAIFVEGCRSVLRPSRDTP
jgi:hypothetical protein